MSIHHPFRGGRGPKTACDLEEPFPPERRAPRTSRRLKRLGLVGIPPKDEARWCDVS